MTLFARCFLLVFCQLGLGGLLSLAVPPFHELARGFYKSSAAVFLSAALIGGSGSLYLLATRPASGVGPIEAALDIAYLVLFALYVATLWGDAVVLRARLYTASLGTGAAALAASALTLAGGHGILLDVLAVAATLASASALGSVTTGMLIGHWYLIDPELEIEPFRRCFRFFVAAVTVELAVLLAVALAALATPGRDAATAYGAHLPLLAMRFALGPVAALGIALLLQRVLALPQTMAATGLFYIATLAVLTGELLGRYFSFLTRLPL